MSFDFSRPIAIGGDHAGFNFKETLKELLQQKGYTAKDFGPFSEDSVDYPDFAHTVTDGVEKREAAFGIHL
jgi:ribose 5-phosphate isomerase B